MAAVAGASSSLIKVAALSGSLRKGSYNRGLVRAGWFLPHTLTLFICFDF